MRIMTIAEKTRWEVMLDSYPELSHRHEAFLAMALIMGPPPEEPLLMEVESVRVFVQLCEELFDMKQQRDVRVLYTVFCLWYAQEQHDHHKHEAAEVQYTRPRYDHRR
jgi:hypothetical protein